MNPAAAKNAVGAAFLGATKMDILRDTDMEDTANDAAIAAALGEHAVHPAAIVGLWADEDDEATWELGPHLDKATRSPGHQSSVRPRQP